MISGYTKAMVMKRIPVGTGKAVRKRKGSLAADDPTLLEDLLEIAHSVPLAALKKLPVDGAARHDEYLDGPKVR